MDIPNADFMPARHGIFHAMEISKDDVRLELIKDIPNVGERVKVVAEPFV